VPQKKPCPKLSKTRPGFRTPEDETCPIYNPWKLVSLRNSMWILATDKSKLNTEHSNRKSLEAVSWPKEFIAVVAMAVSPKLPNAQTYVTVLNPGFPDVSE
jgi:hypothetical protein